MNWTHIDTTIQNESVFDLYEQAGVYAVRVDGYELMNGFWHDSEVLLGRLAIGLARVARPRVLIGGLGLGYTLASASEAMQGDGEITVAEVSGAIIGWFRQYMLGSFFPTLPANVQLVECDIAGLIQTGEAFNVIVLDVDNGPEALAQAGNGFLYSVGGLDAVAQCLGPSGILLVWSSFEAPDFIDRARKAGYHIAHTCLALPHQKNCVHYIYVLSLQSFDENELEFIDRHCA